MRTEGTGVHRSFSILFGLRPRTSLFSGRREYAKRSLWYSIIFKNGLNGSSSPYLNRNRCPILRLSATAHASMLSSSTHCVRLNDQITGGDYRHLTISVALASPFSNPLLPRQRTAEAPNRGQARHTHVSAAAVACLLRRPGQVPAQLRALFCSVPGGDEIRSRPA